jgi:hypothetical protein
MSRILLWAMVFCAQAAIAQVNLHYIPETDDAMDTCSVQVRSTRERDVLLEKALSWLSKELPVTWQDTVLADRARLTGRPIMKLPNWVIASSALVEKRTLEFDLSIWFEGDSLQCAMSRFTYSYAKGKGMRSVPLTEWYRKYHQRNAVRIMMGKEPKPKHDELANMDRSLSALVNRLANALAD